MLSHNISNTSTNVLLALLPRTAIVTKFSSITKEGAIFNAEAPPFGFVPDSGAIEQLYSAGEALTNSTQSLLPSVNSVTGITRVTHKYVAHCTN